jgi:hypothetical protein
MSHLKIYYPECSQNEQEKNNKKIKKESDALLEANEVLKEHILLVRISFLPDELQILVGEYSSVVKQLRISIKFEFFDNWVIQNTDRIMGLLEGWTKPQIGFVLNSIVQLETREFGGYLKGESCYQHWDAKYMRKQIKVYISHRTKIMRPDILEDLRHQSTYTVHNFIPCQVNPEFDKCPPIRVYGAYKAIEEYDARLKMKKMKKGKPKK